MRISFVAAAVLAGVLISPVYADTHSHAHGTEAKPAEHHHDHHHTAPHGGTLVSLGDEAAHVELVLDSAKGEITAYILDGEAEKAIRVKQPEISATVFGRDAKSTISLVLKAVENPLTGEKSGDSSEFHTKSEELKTLKKFKMRINSLVVKGVTFTNVTSDFPEGNH